MVTIKNVLVYISVVVLGYYWLYHIKQAPVYASEKRLDGKTVLITGGNSGVGKGAAIEFAKRGARVVIASRNHEKSILTKEDITKESGNQNVRVMDLDLEDFESIQSFANKFDETENYLDFLVNNAGVFGLPGRTKDQINRVFAINHLGPFYLTNLLMDKMKQQASTRPVRIINISSKGFRFGNINFTNIYPQTETPSGFFGNWKNYGDSKLANIYFTAELHRRFNNYGITAYAIHPGLVRSEITKHTASEWFSQLVFAAFSISPYYGSQTIMYCALDDDVIALSGDCFHKCALLWQSDLAKNRTIADKLWKESERIVHSIS